jgi:hypothetical protein
MENTKQKDPKIILDELKYFLAEEIEYNLIISHKLKDQGDELGYNKHMQSSLSYSNVLSKICDVEEAKNLRSVALKMLRDSGAL